MNRIFQIVVGTALGLVLGVFLLLIIAGSIQRASKEREMAARWDACTNKGIDPDSRIKACENLCDFLEATDRSEMAQCFAKELEAHRDQLEELRKPDSQPTEEAAPVTSIEPSQDPIPEPTMSDPFRRLLPDSSESNN